MTDPITMRDVVVATVTWLGKGTTFAELERDALAAGLDPFGDCAISPDPLWDRNIIMWAGASESFVDALGGLINDQIIEAEPASVLVYLLDGKALDLPVATQLRKYKSTRWVPVTIGPGPNWAAR